MLKLSLTNLTRHKLRTALSVLGIVIGVASLIALVSIVDGIKFEITDALSNAQGARVTPIGTTDPIFNSFDESWGDKIEKIQGVKVAVPNIMQIAKSVEGNPVSIGGGTRLIGINIAKNAKAGASGFNGELLAGRDFVVSDEGKNVAMIGEVVKDSYNKFLGSKINVNGKKLQVIGIYSTGSFLVDNTILMPIETARDVTGFPKNKVSFINVMVNVPSEDQKVVDKINLIYGDEIKASSLSDFSAQFGAIFDSVTALVVVIASIASIVATVGIINTMLMSVLERFKEIGALKAVGWTNENIMKMILYESLFIGIIGGFFGVILGILVSMLIEQFGLTTVVTFELIAGSFLGAVFVGIIAGIYPAFNASKLNPVDALRAE